VANKVLIILLLGLAGRLEAQSHASVIGNRWGLDPVIVAMSNAEAVKDIFGTKLGFSPFRGKYP
jgi:hypothetical protein